MTYYCGVRDKVPFCTCGGKNGSNYKVYSETTGTYHCCNQLPFPIFDSSIDNVQDYLSEIYETMTGNGIESPCVDFYNAVVTKGNIKTNYPELYESANNQRLLNNQVYQGGPPAQVGNTITCPVGFTPYMIEYDDVVNHDPSYRAVCHAGKIPDIDGLSYKVYSFQDKDGYDCTSSSCEMKWEASSGQNLGNVKYNYQKRPFYQEWWFWSILALLALGIAAFSYFMYVYRHRINEIKTERLLRKMSPKAGGALPSVEKLRALADMVELEQQ